MAVVTPLPERRADLRSAFHTAHLLALQLAEPLPPAEFQDLVQKLAGITPADNAHDDAVDYAALAEIGG